MNGEPNAYLAERRKVLAAEMREIEDQMSELAYLNGEALVARFNPAPAPVPEELRGMDWTDTLNRGASIGRRVVVAVDGGPVAR